MRHLTLLLCVSLSAAIINEFSAHVRQKSPGGFPVFGALQGAEAEITVSGQDNVTLVFSLWEQQYWVDTLNYAYRTNSLERLCETPSLARWEVSDSRPHVLRAKLQTDARLVLQILNCYTDGAVDVSGTLVYTNPVLGERWKHLPADNVGLPAIYSIEAAFFWCLASYLTWAVMRGRHFDAHTAAAARQPAAPGAEQPDSPPRIVLPIHYWILSAVVMAALKMSVWAAFMFDYGARGVSNTPLGQGSDILEAAATGTLLAMMMLLALGYGSLLEALSKRQYIAIAFLATFYAGMAVLQVGCNSQSSVGDESCNSIFLVEYIARAIVLLFVVVSINFVLTVLRGQTVNTTWLDSHAETYEQQRRMQWYRWAFLAYLIIPPLTLITRVTIISWQAEWVNTLLSDTASMWLLYTVAVGFAPQPPARNRAAILVAALKEARDSAQAVATAAEGQQQVRMYTNAARLLQLSAVGAGRGGASLSGPTSQAPGASAATGGASSPDAQFRSHRTRTSTSSSSQLLIDVISNRSSAGLESPGADGVGSGSSGPSPSSPLRRLAGAAAADGAGAASLRWRVGSPLRPPPGAVVR